MCTGILSTLRGWAGLVLLANHGKAPVLTTQATTWCAAGIYACHVATILVSAYHKNPITPTLPDS